MILGDLVMFRKMVNMLSSKVFIKVRYQETDQMGWSIMATISPGLKFRGLNFWISLAAGIVTWKKRASCYRFFIVRRSF